jgi:hypothetical protein
MKRVVLVVVAGTVMLAGCFRHSNTGTVCVEPFATSGFRTSNPVEVKQDIVDSVRDSIPSAFKKQMEAETYLTSESNCAKADYVVSGKITVVDTAISSDRDLFIIGRSHASRTFGVGIECSIRDNKTSAILSKYEGYERPTLLEDTLYFLSRNVIQGIRYQK